MSFAILCHLRTDDDVPRKKLRLAHLTFMNREREHVVAGGPTFSEDGRPRTMILLTRFAERSQVDAFLSEEPYTASGEVFASIEIFPWSQVLPEPRSGSLAAEIAKESATP